MKVKIFSAVSIMVLGIVFFTLGLLTILQEGTVLGVLSQILPGAQATEIFGVIAQFLGQALMVFGVMKSASYKFLNNLQIEQQRTAAGFSQTIQQLQTRMQADKQALVAGYNQTVMKLDTLIANQRALATPKIAQVAKCRFCGTRTEQGKFCPQCGKAN